METGTTLFQLKSDRGQPFDGSTRGISILKTSNAKALAGDAGFRIEGGFLEIARHAALDGLQTFTISASIVPEKIAGDRRNIAESQTPGISLFIDPTGKLTGSILTAAGWQPVDSGTALLKENAAAEVRFTRDAAGLTQVEIGGKVVGSKTIAGPIVNAGAAGFKIGAWVDGQKFPFTGQIRELAVVQGVESLQAAADRTTAAQKISDAFKAKTGLKRVNVSLVADESRARLQAVRDLLTAAGVARLSDLSTLRITARTVMTPGRVMIAPKATNVGKVDWSKVATEIATGQAATTRTRLAQFLTNRNSSAVLKAAAPAAAAAGTATSTGVLRASATSSTAATLVTRAAATAAGPAPSTAAPLPVALRRESASVRLNLEKTVLSDQIRADGNALHVLDTGVLKNIEAASPVLWPSTSVEEVHFLKLTTIPVNTAVIIAHVLDLTNTELVIDPAVTKLYIIAEQVTCGPGAQITWARPGGSTPAALDNPDLNGRGWSGVQTKPNSRDGLDGESGRAGGPGIDGARGHNAPDLEMWVKAMTAVPNLDLNGEDGRQGGRGQRGGSGGHGGDGHVGERIWFFGWHCTGDPGDGGDGGNGGDGGPGGRGGNGANGGQITIGVLKGTLATTVTNQSFKIKDQGGQKGPGGDGGPGGSGGGGGRSGVGETCTDAHAGHNGAQGQPGRRGTDGSAPGLDGEISFFEFTEDAWDELLTRPWLSQIVPTKAFPGDVMTLHGSRFTAQDRVVLEGVSLAPTVNADESISVTIPVSTGGGEKSVTVRRDDGTESNRLAVWIKPQLDAFSTGLTPNATLSLTGHAFLNGASVLVDGAAAPTTFVSQTSIKFTVPGTGGGGSAGGTSTVQVRNPDGLVSNVRTASRPRILEIPFRWGTNNLPFPNFTDGVPDWGTFEDTFGAAEVWHEQLDPVFGHPILTAAFFQFYKYFLKGKANGGLATGFCTSLASVVTDKLWKGENDTHTQTKAGLQKMLTAVHGKLLSRESLLHFHDQSRAGLDRVERTAREIEATFLRGTDRQNAPLLFYIPSGEVWDSGYFDRLGDSHCVMPWRFVYPDGHPGPQLSPDSSTTVDDLNGVQLFVWDCNHPESQNCKLVFRTQGGKLNFDYFPDTATAEFSSTNGITLGMMTNGAYMLADHDLPFSGPLGLTTFIIDFLLSPADVQVTDGLGLRTGNFGGQLLSEIPDSHPCYLAKGMYMLPANTALTRRIVGSGAGSYSYMSLIPGQGSIVLEGVATAPGHEDVLSVNADGTQIRFSAAADKTFDVTLAKVVGQQSRAIAIRGIGAQPGADVDITIAPDLSVARVGNRAGAKTVEVRAFSVDKSNNLPVNHNVPGVSLPTQADLVVAIPDWSTLNVNVQTVSFQ